MEHGKCKDYCFPSQKGFGVDLTIVLPSRKAKCPTLTLYNTLLMSSTLSTMGTAGRSHQTSAYLYSTSGRPARYCSPPPPHLPRKKISGPQIIFRYLGSLCWERDVLKLKEKVLGSCCLSRLVDSFSNVTNNLPQ